MCVVSVLCVLVVERGCNVLLSFPALTSILEESLALAGGHPALEAADDDDAASIFSPKSPVGHPV